MRIVQDSDDDLDDEIEVPVQNQPNTTEKPPAKEASQQSHGTGSTGKAAAHLPDIMVLTTA